MNLGDTVIYTEGGVERYATVLGIHALDDHFGGDNEPLLHLGFFVIPEKPGADGLSRPVSLVGTHDQYSMAQFRLDVAHESHSWNEKQQDKYQAKVYPGGRWKELQISTFTGSVTEENPTGSGGETPSSDNSQPTTPGSDTVQ